MRPHRIDENASDEVAPLLAYLRELQRRHHLAVLLVHHAKKSSGRLRAGQPLRGSSEFHAWGDSNLYRRRDGPKLTLTAEHRAAPSMTAIDWELATRNEALALEVLAPAPGNPPASTSIDERITAALIEASQPLSISQLRPLCRARKTTLRERLTVMTAAGHLRREANGYHIAVKPQPNSILSSRSHSLYSSREPIPGTPSNTLMPSSSNSLFMLIVRLLEPQQRSHQASSRIPAVAPAIAPPSARVPATIPAPLQTVADSKFKPPLQRSPLRRAAEPALYRDPSLSAPA